MWGAYNFIPADYEHLTVNHAYNFVDPITQAHTNTIEATWNVMKKDISVRNRRAEGMEEQLWSFMWRRAHTADLWGGFINAICRLGIYEMLMRSFIMPKLQLIDFIYPIILEINARMTGENHITPSPETCRARDRKQYLH
jgi:hypothetical protein